jgi:hypothetical protein
VLLRDGRYVYAQLNPLNQLMPTDWQVGEVNPRTMGLNPRILPPRESRPGNLNAGMKPYRPWASHQIGPQKNITATGTVKNLVVLCKFSDHTFGVQTRIQGDYNVLFNQIGGDPVLAPTGSVQDAYTENSYGIVTLQSTVLAWVTLPQTMAFYAGTNNGLGADYPNNAKKMVQDALALADVLVDFGQFDADNANRDSSLRTWREVKAKMDVGATGGNASTGIATTNPSRNTPCHMSASCATLSRPKPRSRA